MARRALLVVKTLVDRSPATVEEELTSSPHAAMVHSKVAALIQGAGAGLHGGESIIRIDSVSTTSDLSAVTKSVLVTEVSTTTKADTLSIGAVTLVLTTTSVSENSITFSTTNSPTQVATAITAAVNAHSKLQGIITATASGARATFSFLAAGRMGDLVRLAESSVALTLSGDTSFASGGSLTTQYASTKFGNFT